MASKQFWTSKDVQEHFNVTGMTVYLWRKGTSKRAPIPHFVEPRGQTHSVRFPIKETKAWAKKHGVLMAADKVEGTTAGSEPAPSKPKRVKASAQATTQ